MSVRQISSPFHPHSSNVSKHRFCMQLHERVPAPYHIVQTHGSTGTCMTHVCAKEAAHSIHAIVPPFTYRDDGVFMMPPFIAAYGAASNNQTLLQIAYDQCRLYRNALRQYGPTGPLWGHIFSDDDGGWWVDQGLWSTGELSFFCI